MKVEFILSLLLIGIVFLSGCIGQQTGGVTKPTMTTQPKKEYPTVGDTITKNNIAVKLNSCSLKGIKYRGGALGQVAGMHYTYNFEVENKGDKTLYVNPEKFNLRLPDVRNLLILNDNYGRVFKDDAGSCCGYRKVDYETRIKIYGQNVEYVCSSDIKPEEKVICSFTINDPAWAVDESMVASWFNVTLLLREYSWDPNDFSNYESFSFYVKTKDCTRD